MVKNAYFCIAKSKIDDPEGSFWIGLLGTDRLEELFGILRTMVGNDTNVDILQLVSRLSGTTEVSNILAKYPEWDRTPRRLKIPAITRDSKELPDRSDHLKPTSWRGDVRLKNVSLLTAWKRGRHLVEAECPWAAVVLQTLEQTPGVDILSPRGILLVNAPLDDDDVDLSWAMYSESEPSLSAVSAVDDQPLNEDVIANRIEVEDLLNDIATHEKFAQSTPHGLQSGSITIGGTTMPKSRALARYSKYRKTVSSTDRLKRVQEVERYSSSYSSRPNTTISMDLQVDEPTLLVSDPIASIIFCEDRAWLCIGEVNGLKIDGDATDFVPHTMLSENTVSISYQVLGLRPASSDDDPSQKHDWRTCRLSQEQTFTVPGRIIQSINPKLADINDVRVPGFYLLDSQVIAALASSLFELLSLADLKTIPKLAPMKDFPYRESAGMFL
jgi:hypothetical protein